MESLNQGLQSFGPNAWMTTLFQVMSYSFQEELTPASLSKNDEPSKPELTILPPLNPILLAQGPAFVKLNGENQLPP